MAEELIKLGGYVVQGHGYDETVLWEGEVNKNNLNITLTESLINFEKVKFIFNPRKGAYTDALQEIIFETSNEFIRYLIYGCYNNADDYWITLWSININDKNITNDSCYYKSLTNNNAKVEQVNAYLYKVIGVNRKDV